MATKAKAFDCAEIKHRVQEKLRAEYEVRRGEFDSYSAFLAATINEDPRRRKLWLKISAPLSGKTGQTQTHQ